ncbi:DoxX family protein [Myxococcus sp. CA033]|nr:DoxX family protein [Myxococcus sp. CA033]
MHRDRLPPHGAPLTAVHAASSSSVSPPHSAGASKKALWTGRILSGLAVLFLIFDAVGKVLSAPQFVEGTLQLGYPASVVVGLGVLQLVFLAVYLVPRTSVLGAVLWTGYLGGAIATHVRVESPLFTHVLSPVYFAAFLWVGLWLRNERLRSLLPFREAQ